MKTVGLVTMLAVSLFAASFTASHAFAQTGTSKITVRTVDSSGEIFGYFTVLSQGIFGLATGYTASSFTVNNGETYNVGVQNYGDFEFDHWLDTGSTVANRDFAITSDTEYYAVYRNINDPADPNASRLTIRTVNSAGEEITGYWTVFYQDSAVVQTGFSPERFIANDGETYEVFMGDFAGKSFDHWEDGSTENPRTFSITSDQTFTANYNENNVCIVTVVTETSSGQEVNAWTVFHAYSEGNQHGEGTRLQTGFSPATFEAGCGESYEVVVRDTPSSAFDHWDDGSTDEWRVFSVDSDTTFTATYSP